MRDFCVQRRRIETFDVAFGKEDNQQKDRERKTAKMNASPSGTHDAESTVFLPESHIRFDIVEAQSRAHLRDRFLTQAFQFVFVVTVLLIVMLVMISVLDTLLILCLRGSESDSTLPQRLVTSEHITKVLIGIGVEVVGIIVTMGLFLWKRGGPDESGPSTE